MDVFGQARFGNERVCPEAVRASDIAHFTAHSHNHNEELLESRLRAQPFKNLEPIFVGHVNVEHHD